MDYLLPDEESMRLMGEEYSRLGAGERAASAAAYINELPLVGGSFVKNTDQKQAIAYAPDNYIIREHIRARDITSSRSRQNFSLDLTSASDDSTGLLPERNDTSNDKTSVWLLILYIICSLRYNSDYGTKVYDPNRGLGGLQSDKGAFRDLNHIV